jgi:tight adherence protein B
VEDLLLQLLPLGIGAAIFVSVLMLMLLFSGNTEKTLNALTGRYAQALKIEFDQLQLPLSPSQFIFFQTGLALALFAIGVVTGPDALTKIAMGLLFAYLGFWGCRRWLKDQHVRRKRKFQEQFADAAALIGNTVRSGLSLVQALEVVVREMDDPMAYELYQVLQATRVGAPLDTVLEDWAARMNNTDLDIFVTAIIIQRQTGGDLAHVLNTLAHTVRQRQRIQGQISALTAQGRLGAMVLAGLPVFMGVILYFLNPGRMSLMVSHPIGWGMLFASAATIIGGIVVVQKIVEIDI